ncbi:HU family DNA-binding protein [Thermodesulforhabdus norvegica]|uniref:DNA-binding protein HU-beta n=1 Tax=Thermodesulforhabdus norvegica TaxID=39841 RepID=A0A1I4T9E7_9BACT|nr:HU family DNA-binding protein [Thermodesulforhabdus norvegica]SFM73352.1 DNA-binding protein HU-beta [Thermodesulforhabdus norvegica]
MTKAELVSKMAEKANISKANAEKALNAFIETVKEALSQGDKISLVGFGTFSVAERSAREGRNPKTGEKLTIPACKVVKFKPGNMLRDAVK